VDGFDQDEAESKRDERPHVFPETSRDAAPALFSDLKRIERIVVALTTSMNGPGGTAMGTTSAQRVRAHRARRRRGEILLPVRVSAVELKENALQGYEGAASTYPKVQAEAVALCG
jgi:hypothetical protein